MKRLKKDRCMRCERMTAPQRPVIGPPMGSEVEGQDERNENGSVGSERNEWSGVEFTAIQQCGVSEGQVVSPPHAPRP